MDILGTLLASARNGSLSQAAQSRGVDSSGVEALLKQLVPALTNGVKQNAASKDGLNNLTRALTQGNHQRYLDDKSALDSAAAVDDGNNILGHILGSKDVSRQLAARAAGNTGIDVDTIKKLLPVIAAATMGAMSKGKQSSSSGLSGMLGGLLDADGDGSVVDDLLSLGKKFLK
jgi:hypothetical protein